MKSFPPLGKGVGALGEEEKAAVLEVLESRSLFRYYGPHFLGRTAAFEEHLAAYVGSAHAVATASGTAALRTALAALGVGCGDEVIVPAFTFIATVNAVVVSGAVPVFAEIDDTLNIDATDVAAKLSDRTTAVIPVHLENVACDMDALRDIDVPVIEDTAQSLGARYHGRALGTIGDLGTFSLQLEKNITAGEGGAVVTDDDALFERAARYQDQGGQFFTSHGGGRGEMAEPFVGENLRMTELAGAIADVQLIKLDALLSAMRANNARIRDAVGAVDGLVPRRSPDPDGDGGSSLTWFAPTPELARRFVAALRAERVPAAQMYNGEPVYATPSILERRTASGKGGPWNCAEHPPQVEYRMGMCPRTEDLAARSFTVGVGPAYTPDHCDGVAEAVVAVAKELL